MPFIPLLLPFAWQTTARVASIVLGWATELFFGQVPGKRGQALAVLGMLALVWIFLVAFLAVPLPIIALAGFPVILGEDTASIEAWHVALLVAAAGAAPPFIEALAFWTGFRNDGGFHSWLRQLPRSYLVAASLGAAVLIMVLVAPVLRLQHRRRKVKAVHVPLVVPEDTLDPFIDELKKLMRDDGLQPRQEEFRGPGAWPLRILGYAAEHLLGSVVRGEPCRLVDDGVNVVVQPTNVSVTGPADQAYRLRAAIQKRLSFCDPFLTWDDDAQAFETELLRVHRDADGHYEPLVERLDQVQARMDMAELESDAWNLLYRFRLQIERDALLEASARERHVSR
ncbi:MAG: hypothetical protein H0V12_04050 [Chloroflexi bacterium]|nr:hypothetical protein [Chloroflexota bacterium]